MLGRRGERKKNRVRRKDDGREKKKSQSVCVWQAASEISGEKERGKMKGAERLGGSCESKCGREQTKRN